jgi:PAS domain-containing protein
MQNMPKATATRQRTRKGSEEASRTVAQRSLARAFTSFTQAAGSLEKSYLQLQGEVTHLHEELHRTNAELERTLEENARVRAYLSRVLESLPCGILVVNANAQTQIINPEARRLLAVSPDWAPGQGNPLPAALQKQFENIPANSFFSEQEWLAPETPANRSIGILRANVSELMDGQGDTIWIIRDIVGARKRAQLPRFGGSRRRAGSRDPQSTRKHGTICRPARGCHGANTRDSSVGYSSASWASKPFLYG